MPVTLSQQLSVQDVVNVTVSLSATVAQGRNFNALLIIGPNTAISTSERMRQYSGLDGIAQDFGTNSSEYAAAASFFSQNPQPTLCYVGRWAKTDTNAELIGGTLTSSEQTLSNFTGVTAGGFDIVIGSSGGTSTHKVSGINLTGAANLNAVANDVQTALQAADAPSTCVWNSEYGRFEITFAESGSAATLEYPIAPTTDATTDIRSLFGFTAAAGAKAISGIAAETPVAAVQVLANLSAAWYGAMFADPSLTIQQHLAVSVFIEGASLSRIYGYTSQDTEEMDPTSTTSLGAQMTAAKYNRTIGIYSSTSPYAIAAVFGNGFVTDFSGQNTTETLKFKTLTGVIAENLTETQGAALTSKRINVFASYQNGEAILQEGWMASGRFFDTIQGFDWLQNQAQTDIFNFLKSQKKVPQTDPGVELIVGTLESTLAQAVTNGLLAAGLTWTGAPLGVVSNGQTLTKGYYVYVQPVRLQSLSDRAARKAPLLQAIVTGAGAVHFASAAITVVT